MEDNDTPSEPELVTGGGPDENPAAAVGGADAPWKDAESVADVAAADIAALADRFAAAWVGECRSEDTAMVVDVITTAGALGAVSLMWNGGALAQQVSSSMAASLFLEAETARIIRLTRYKSREVAKTANDIDELLLDGDVKSAVARSIEALSNLTDSIALTKHKSRTARRLDDDAAEITLRSAALLRALRHSQAAAEAA